MSSDSTSSRNTQAPSGKVIYRRLLGYAFPYWPVFIITSLCMALYAATETGFAALMKPMLDESFVNKDPQAMLLVPLGLIGLFLIRGVVGFISTYGMSWIGRKVIAVIRAELFRKLLYLPASYYDNIVSGQLISRMTYNVDQVAQASTDVVTILVRDTLTIIILLAWLFYLSGILSLIFLTCGPLIALVVVYVSKRFRKISTRIQDSMGEITHVTQEAIDGQEVVKTFGGHEYEESHFQRINENNRQQQLKMVATSALSVPVIQLLAACALAGIVYLATLDLVSNITSAGEFASFLTAMLLLLPPMKRLSLVNGNIQKGIAAAESIFELLDHDEERDTGLRTLPTCRGEIEYRNVSFTYAGSDHQVLENVSFRILPGQKVAFVGRSGSGKSTLVNLLPRFYEPQQGEILLDGENIDRYQLAELRKQMALVTQQVTLFNDSVANNIAYGVLQDTPVESIVHAAEAAHAMEFIRQLPQGLDTLVGEDGTLLSGGQRQRLAIARALLKNSPVLILDEATSALDTESEQHVQAGLERLMQNRTTLVIAHRLSTVENADLIIVMDKGRIVETGTHQELLEEGGHYALLYRMQFRDE